MLRLSFASEIFKKSCPNRAQFCSNNRWKMLRKKCTAIMEILGEFVGEFVADRHEYIAVCPYENSHDLFFTLRAKYFTPSVKYFTPRAKYFTLRPSYDCPNTPDINFTRRTVSTYTRSCPTIVFLLAATYEFFEHFKKFVSGCEQNHSSHDRLFHSPSV